jgi:hypothetical protein
MMTENIETRTRRYRGISYTRPIDEAKRRVPVIDLADRLCGPGACGASARSGSAAAHFPTMRTARHRSW